MEKNKRYIATKDNVSIHYWYDYAVVDTKYGKDNNDMWNKQLCITFNKKDADKIANALNFYNDYKINKKK